MSRGEMDDPLCPQCHDNDKRIPLVDDFPSDSHMALARCTTPATRKWQIGLHGCVNACLPSAIEKIGSPSITKGQS